MSSDNFGPALNKHLPVILPMIQKKQDLASKERLGALKERLLQNGGHEAKQILGMFPFK